MELAEKKVLIIGLVSLAFSLVFLYSRTGGEGSFPSLKQQSFMSLSAEGFVDPEASVTYFFSGTQTFTFPAVSYLNRGKLISLATDSISDCEVVSGAQLSSATATFTGVSDWFYITSDEVEVTGVSCGLMLGLVPYDQALKDQQNIRGSTSILVYGLQSPSVSVTSTNT